jgi:hypothetical protein
MFHKQNVETVDQKEQKHALERLDMYVVFTLVVFLVVVDVTYPYLQFKMGIQLSDWWLAANVIVAVLELLCCTIIYISKVKGGKIDPQTMKLIEIVGNVAAGVAGSSFNLSNLSETSGATEDDDSDDDSSSSTTTSSSTDSTDGGDGGSSSSGSSTTFDSEG